MTASKGGGGYNGEALKKKKVSIQIEKISLSAFKLLTVVLQTQVEKRLILYI